LAKRSIDRSIDGSNDDTNDTIPSIRHTIAFSNHAAHGFPKGKSSLLGTVNCAQEDAIDQKRNEQAEIQQKQCRISSFDPSVGRVPQAPV